MPTVFEPRSFFFLFLALLISLYIHFHNRHSHDVAAQTGNFIEEVSATIASPFRK